MNNNQTEREKKTEKLNIFLLAISKVSMEYIYIFFSTAFNVFIGERVIYRQF